MSDDVTRLAEVLENRLSWASLHWFKTRRSGGIESVDVQSDVGPALAQAVLASEWLHERDALNRIAGAVRTVHETVQAYDELVERMEALADEWERLASGNEAARGAPTKVAGYYRRHAHQLRAALNDPTEETTP